MDMQYKIRELHQNENDLLKTFLYEAIISHFTSQRLPKPGYRNETYGEHAHPAQNARLQKSIPGCAEEKLCSEAI